MPESLNFPRVIESKTKEYAVAAVVRDMTHNTVLFSFSFLKTWQCISQFFPIEFERNERNGIKKRKMRGLKLLIPQIGGEWFEQNK
jgi:hypothetical protein